MEWNVFIPVIVIALIMAVFYLFKEWLDEQKSKGGKKKVIFSVLGCIVSLILFFVSETYPHLIPQWELGGSTSESLHEESLDNNPTETDPIETDTTELTDSSSQTDSPTETETEAPTEKETIKNNSGGTAPTSKPTAPKETQPPATKPPATEPPATRPPATEPPATKPPATDPPATEPPATEPPVTEPPATDPPVTDPPATDPPVTEPVGAPPTSYSISLTSSSVFVGQPFYVIVTPDVDNYTKIVIHAIDPTGGRWDFTISGGNSKDLMVTEPSLTGTWTIYADVYNPYGVFYGASGGARAKLTVYALPL